MGQPATSAPVAPKPRITWSLSLPFLLAHLSFVLIAFTGISWQLVALAAVSYAVRMFFTTAGYHRYFSHRTFKTGRVMQFLLAAGAQTSMQKGVLWWAAHHRDHHRHSDQPEDIHSPAQRGFWWSHMGWILSDQYSATKFERIKDFARFPELRWLNKWHLVPAAVGGLALFLIGGLPWLVWGGLIPTVFLWHATFTINSLNHIWGSRKYLTTDTSRNNLLFALMTGGEGWHNNHHFHQNTANQGWFWWQVDTTFYALKVMSWVGLISDLRVVSEQTRMAYKAYTPEQVVSLKESVWFKSARARLTREFDAAVSSGATALQRVPERLGVAPAPLPRP